MEGGINSWKGLTAEGPPESGMAYFPEASKSDELIALAWLLEDGSRRFYSSLAGLLTDLEGKGLFAELTAAEERHQASLLDLHKGGSTSTSDAGFPGAAISSGNEGDVMEGGIRVSEALSWAGGKSLTEIVEFALSLETNSYDLYVKMGRRNIDRRSAQVFHVLSDEEKRHLARLSSLLEKKM
jgi:sulfur-carrier protein adenylyltransferase/sulfurtransferase